MRPNLFAVLASLLSLVLLTSGVSAFALQEQHSHSEEQHSKEASSTPIPLAPKARLASAKTAWLKRTGSGGDIAYNVVNSALDGWGRFMLVDAPEKADVIIEIYSVEESGGGISASTGPGRQGTTQQMIPALIKLTVYDARTHIPLWMAAEHPRGAMKKADREEREVESAQRLIAKFHDDLEPVK